MDLKYNNDKKQKKKKNTYLSNNHLSTKHSIKHFTTISHIYFATSSLCVSLNYTKQFIECQVAGTGITRLRLKFDYLQAHVPPPYTKLPIGMLSL